MSELGHVVFYVRELQRSVEFYTKVVGLGVQGRIFNGRAALLSGGRTHHELLLIEVGDAPAGPAGRRIGLYHVGWKIGEDLDTLERAYARATENGCVIDGLADHTISQSMYLRDPDGNEVELFVDSRNFDWRNDKSWMDAPVKPLKFEI